jgi:hypothetical protein
MSRRASSGPLETPVAFCGISGGALRSTSSILLTLALLVAFVEAPFAHTHRHDSTQRHAGAFLHFHLKSAGPVSRTHEFRGLDPNEDAQYQAWFSATPTNSVPMIPVVLAERYALSAPEHSGWVVEAQLRIGHDPPRLCSRSPRAPPA